MRPRRGSLEVVVLALSLAGACAEQRPAEPPPPPPFSMEDTARKLEPLALDDAFFSNLDALVSHAEKTDAPPEATIQAARFHLAALAFVAVSGGPATPRVLGSPKSDTPAVARALADLARKLKSLPKGGEVGAVVAGLAALHGLAPGTDLDPLLRSARSESPYAPAARLLLAQRYLQALSETTGAPESDRGTLVLQALPGIPNPPTRDPRQTAFPASLRTLSELLRLGPGHEKGLAPSYRKLAEEAAAEFGPKAFAIPVLMDPEVRPGNPLAGAACGYCPLATVGIRTDGFSFGSRPAFVWTGDGPSDPTEAIGWPGRTLANAEETEAGGDSLVEKVKAALDKARLLDPVEAKAYPAWQGKAALNGERPEGRGQSVLLGLDPSVMSRSIRAGLEALTRAGATDLRMLQPGGGRVLPVFFRKIPEIKGVSKPDGRRLVIELTATSADAVLPLKEGEKPGPAPEGTKVVAGREGMARYSAPWKSDRGFGGVLGRMVGHFRKAGYPSPVVEVVIRAKDVWAMTVIDAVAEIAGSDGRPFPGLADFFPGLVCPANGLCVAAVPVLFSDAVIQAAKAEGPTAVEERPAGFCDKGAVARTIVGRAGAYRACYERELTRRPDLEGRVELRFTIEPDGSVSGIVVTANTLGVKNIEECLVRQVSGLKFPRPDGGVCIIRWPFKFQPGG